MMLVTDASHPDELIFVAPQHVVSVRYTDNGAGSEPETLIGLIDGSTLRVLEDRNDVAEDVERQLRMPWVNSETQVTA